MIATNRNRVRQPGGHWWRGWGAGVLAGSLMAGAVAERFTGPWDIDALCQVPEYEWGKEVEDVREVFYAALPYLGKPTRVFAWLGIPESDEPVPGMLLIHGAGQNARRDWVRYWMDRGYAALSMDLDGQSSWGPLPDGGPRFATIPYFGPFPHGDLKEGWIYHAVADVMLAHSLLAAQPGVDPERIGINGVSLGSTLVCTVAGVDARLRAAAPVYGAAFLHEGGYWQERIRFMDCHRAAEWMSLLDASVYLPGVTCPILFQNGATDRFTPPDAYHHSWAVCGGERTLALRPELNHGNFWRWPWGGIEVNLFLDHHLRGGPAPPLIQVIEETESNVVCAVTSDLPVVAVHFAYTTDLGPWSKRQWHEEPLAVDPARFTVSLPEARPLWAFVMVAVETRPKFNGWFSTPYFFRDYPESPSRIILDEVTLDSNHLVVRGRKPFGLRILFEKSTDLCHWEWHFSHIEPTIEFEVTLPLGGGDYRFLRARKREPME